MTAVIWTDVVQMSLYVFGAVASFFVILGQIPGGWAHVAAVAGAAHKFSIFDFRFSPTMAYFSRPYTFWAGSGGRMLPHHRQPRNRSAHGAAPVERAQRAPEPRRAALELGGDFLSIHAVPPDRRSALRVLPRHGHAGAPADRSHLPGIHLEASAGGRGRVGYRGHPGRRHGQPERRLELARFHHGGGLFRARGSSDARSCESRGWQPSPGAWCCWPSPSPRAIRGRCWRRV
jgi:hypothetical protein